MHKVIKCVTLSCIIISLLHSVRQVPSFLLLLRPCCNYSNYTDNFLSKINSTTQINKEKYICTFVLWSYLIKEATSWDKYKHWCSRVWSCTQLHVFIIHLAQTWLHVRYVVYMPHNLLVTLNQIRARGLILMSYPDQQCIRSYKLYAMHIRGVSTL